MSLPIIPILNGLASASSLFLVACGLSIVFGVTRIVNFAHGSLYMLGAYMAWTLVSHLPTGALGFWGGILLGALLVSLIGGAIEILLLRRIYRAPEILQLLATFGVVLVIQDVALSLWGARNLLGPRAPGLHAAVLIAGERFPEYELFLIVIGPLVLGGLWLLFHRTRWGTLVRAATLDREMVASLGVDQRLLFTSVFLLGSFLAALGGGLQLPRHQINLNMDLEMIADAFVVVVVGGMGSISGAFLAALLIEELRAFLYVVPSFSLFGLEVVPSKMTLVSSFAIMAVVLMLRPYGLLGRRPAAPAVVASESVLRRSPRELRWAAVGLLTFLLILPTFAAGYTLSVVDEIAIYILVAASLHFIMGPGGMISFGHAAYFGLGAYAVALLSKHAFGAIGVKLLLAWAAGGLAGALFGWFCVRLSGVYLGMLTLAFAQIVWSIAFQWDSVTGAENGILDIVPPPWAHNSTVFFYLTLTTAIGGTLLLRRIIYSPFGYALRAGRDSPSRAETIGINVGLVQWMAFVLATGFAGLAGGLFAFLKGSVFPTYISIPQSVDALLMVLLGGVQTVSGPIVGAIVYTNLHDQLLWLTEYWRFALGFLIILIVLAFPEGIAGFVVRHWRHKERPVRERAA